LERAFPTDGEAYEEHEEVDDLVQPKASSHQGPLVGESLQYSLLGEIVCDEDDFGKPGRHRRAVLRRSLDLNTRGGYHRERDLLMRE
jgi:hypothetical protein